ncbi:MAG: hypothetical protein ABIF77_10220 [bacterium]
MDLDRQYFAEILPAFIRGRLGIPARDEAELRTAARSVSLRLAKFKRSRLLPRVQNVLGILQVLAPDSLLDIGSGRGVFRGKQIQQERRLFDRLFDDA